jgi:ABC-type multidrug transport system fused ATPase/permease subunit
VDSGSLRSWQNNLGYVPQQIFLTDDTIENNIAFGVPEASIDTSAVRKASRVANLHAFVERDVPQGYHSRVGERGVRLSGGQRQRIGIARALYNDPSLLVLDEATSSLDSLTEEAVMEAIGNLAHRKTIVMIAHRITTVRNCDVIHVMDRGKVIASGTYEELLDGVPMFRRLANVDSPIAEERE